MRAILKTFTRYRTVSEEVSLTCNTEHRQTKGTETRVARVVESRAVNNRVERKTWINLFSLARHSLSVSSLLTKWCSLLCIDDAYDSSLKKINGRVVGNDKCLKG